MSYFTIKFRDFSSTKISLESARALLMSSYWNLVVKRAYTKNEALEEDEACIVFIKDEIKTTYGKEPGPKEVEKLIQWIREMNPGIDEIIV